MKHRLLLVLLVLAALGGRAQPATPYAKLAKLVETPGAVFIRDSLWMDEAEVANIHWLEYLRFLRQDSTEAQYRAALPDTTVYQLGTNDIYSRHYLRYPGFRYYPVVGITPAQAANYCRWRTAMVNQRLHSAAYLLAHPKLRNYVFRVEYRLPTVREWELAAAGGLDPAQYPYGLVLPPVPGSRFARQLLVRRTAPQARAVDACQPAADRQPDAPVFRMPFKVVETYYRGTVGQAFNCPALDSLARRGPGTPAGLATPTQYIYANLPNPAGLFNMIGNVAELTTTLGVAKGGSFSQPVGTATIQATTPYTRPQLWLGFRCVCTVYIEP